MPRPRSLPAAFDAASRAAKPSQSARARPWSSTSANFPLSYTWPMALV